ncbi:hypothetical protein HMPREF1544_07872 [Mucor circinelloides 1006PhL]|uniref:Uncharacterized protein n=1 Tax=Mucor circinelloides f. circinelloides (strain 1006PhL) TaxID=1220926 RepID=S2J5C6_MUCC1|nr:hypothetical protein HMPREF1544_07872 [Mucor circinelloides 1006PhL]
MTSICFSSTLVRCRYGRLSSLNLCGQLCLWMALSEHTSNSTLQLPSMSSSITPPLPWLFL